MKVQRHTFSTMSPEALSQLGDELATWGLTVWHSNFDDLKGYWLEDKSYETFIYLLRTNDGQLVGSSTMKLFRFDYQGREIHIVKFALGVSPEHRGHKFAVRCLMREMVKWRIRHPFLPLYAFATLIHPVTYKLCCDLLSTQLYPHFLEPENPEMAALACFLVEQFNVQKGDSTDPLVYKEVFSAMETEEAVTHWVESPRPEVRFYLEHCPNYHSSGECLIMAAPIRLARILWLMSKTLTRNRITRLRGKNPKFLPRESP